MDANNVKDWSLESTLLSNDKQDQLYIILRGIISKKLKVDVAVVDILISAFVHEPAVEEGTEASDYKYVHGDKAFLPGKVGHFHTYIEEYGSKSSSEHKEMSFVKKCPSFDGAREHLFLDVEGSHKCSKCCKTFCKMCAFIPSNESKCTRDKIYFKDMKENICLNCYHHHRLGGNDDDNEQQTVTFGSNTISLAEMVSQLNEKIALPIGHGASPAEIVDIFESYISSSTNVRDAVHTRLIAERVKYPLEEPNLIEKYENIGNRRGFLKVGSPFSFFDGGCFISNKEIVSDTNLASILKLLASLVS